MRGFAGLHKKWGFLCYIPRLLYLVYRRGSNKEDVSLSNYHFISNLYNKGAIKMSTVEKGSDADTSRKMIFAMVCLLAMLLGLAALAVHLTPVVN